MSLPADIRDYPTRKRLDLVANSAAVAARQSC
jgi:hypothetical protein